MRSREEVGGGGREKRVTFTKGGTPMIYGNVTNRHIERTPARVALPACTPRFVAFEFASSPLGSLFA